MNFRPNKHEYYKHFKNFRYLLQVDKLLRILFLKVSTKACMSFRETYVDKQDIEVIYEIEVSINPKKYKKVM